MDTVSEKTKNQEQSLQALQWPVWIDFVKSLCATPQGRRFVQAWRPFGQKEAAHQRQQEIEEVAFIHQEQGLLHLQGLTDWEDMFLFLDKGEVLAGTALQALAHTAKHLQSVRNAVARYKARCGHLWKFMAEIPETFAFVSAVEHMLDEQGLLRDQASPRLFQIRQHIAREQQLWEKHAQQLFDTPGLTTAFQERYITQREGRYVIPLRAEAQAALRGMVVDRSASGATVFVEPEALIEGNNRLRLLRLEQHKEEQVLFQQLTDQVRAEQDALQHAQQAMAHLDGVQAVADWMSQKDWKFIPFADEKQTALDLRGAQHPLLCIQSQKVVPNDVALSLGHGLVISGPNAGGKTAYLKMMGLLVWMHQAGMPVPVHVGSQLPWFQQVWVEIGDQQNLSAHVSTFSAHVKHLREMAESSNDKDLVLIDEISMGTDPEQGAALARAYIEYLLARGITVVVTTHDPSLKWLAAQDPRVRNASVGFDLKHMQPTYRLVWDVPGASETFAVAQQYGLSPEIMTRARQLLREEWVQAEAVLRTLGDQHTRLQQREREAERALEGARQREQQAEAERQAFQEARRRLRQEAADEVIRTLQQTRREVEQLRRSLRQQSEKPLPSTKIQEARKQLGQWSQEVGVLRVKEEQASSRSEPVSLQPGTTVYVLSLQRSGVVLSPPENGWVWLQVGTWKMHKPVTDVSAVHPRREQQKLVSLPLPAPTPVVVQTISNTVDVRGQRAEEATTAVEKFVDQALRLRTDVVFVIHGHGTGALKQAIRHRMLSFPGVVRITPAEPSEGGDGVSILYLE